MPRGAFWFIIVVGALAVTGLGLLWGWTSWRGQVDLLTQGVAAYDKSDFHRASELRGAG